MSKTELLFIEYQINRLQRVLILSDCINPAAVAAYHALIKKIQSAGLVATYNEQTNKIDLEYRRGICIK